MKQDTDLCDPLLLRSRLHKHSTARPHVLMHNISHTDSLKSKKGCPVVFATNRPAHRGKSKVVNSKSEVAKYTLNNLIYECHIPDIDETPFTSCLAII